MKKQILSFLFVLSAILLISTSAYAQPTTVSIANTQSSYADLGSTRTYAFASPTTGFTWSIARISGTGTAPSIDSDGNNSQTIVWASPGVVAGDVYEVRAYITADGCYSDMYAYRVTITNAILCIAQDGAANLAGTSDPTGVSTCSLIETSTDGNSSGAPDQTIFFLTIKSGIPSATYKAYYSVDGSEVSVPVSITLDASGNGYASVTLSHAAYATLFTNISSTDHIIPVVATRITDNSDANNSTNRCANSDFDITVKSRPVISFN